MSIYNVAEKDKVRLEIENLKYQIQEVIGLIENERRERNTIEVSVLEQLKVRKSYLEERLIKLSKIRGKVDKNSSRFVKFTLHNNGKEEIIAIVPPLYINPTEKKISSDSPFGKRLLTSEVGDIIVFDFLNNKKEFTVTKIEKLPELD